MSEQKSILLLGGSRQQVIAIEKARRLGYRTVLCDYLPDNPGQHVADVFYLESTTDREKMLEIARRERVSGVLAYSSDPAAPTAAYVAQELDLPTNPLDSVMTLSEKHRFRAHLQRVGLPCPKAVSIAVDANPHDVLLMADELGMRYPVVLKPTDSSGSKGVSVIESPDPAAYESALHLAARLSRNGVLVLEEYIRAGFPHVIGGDIFVVNGEVRFWGLMACLRDKALGGLVPTGKQYPAGLDEEQERAVKQVLQQLVSSLDLKFGEMNVEVILGEDGLPYVLELGARAGGNMIPVQLSDIAGIDLVEANVLYAMGDTSLDVRFDGADAAVATHVLHSDKSGTFRGVHIAPSLQPYVYRQVLYTHEGDQVFAFNGADKALGIVFMRFDTVEQMEKHLRRIDHEITPQVG